MHKVATVVPQVLIAAAVVSLIIGIIEDPGHGWIEGTAIVIASKCLVNRCGGLVVADTADRLRGGSWQSSSSLR
jgi:hypothetical protein